MVEKRLDAAISALQTMLRSKPLDKEAWLQFIFDGDAAEYNFSASGEGMLGIGGGSLGGSLSQPGIPHIEFRCDGETFVTSGRLNVQGGKDIGGGPAWKQAGAVRRYIVRELDSRFIPKMKLGRDMVGRAGEHFVAAELNRHGAYASPWAGNLPGIDIVAMNASQEKPAFIQVKTKGDYPMWRADWRDGWVLPREKDVECIYWGRCDYPDHKPKPIRKYGKDTGRETRCVDLEKQNEIPGKNNHFWVFVAAEDPPKEVRYWIVPDDYVRELIRCRVRNWLRDERPDHHRPNNVKSTDFGVLEQHLEGYQGKWSELGLGLRDD